MLTTAIARKTQEREDKKRLEDAEREDKKRLEDAQRAASKESREARHEDYRKVLAFVSSCRIKATSLLGTVQVWVMFPEDDGDRQRGYEEALAFQADFDAKWPDINALAIGSGSEALVALMDKLESSVLWVDSLMEGDPGSPYLKGLPTDEIPTKAEARVERVISDLDAIRAQAREEQTPI